MPETDFHDRGELAAQYNGRADTFRGVCRAVVPILENTIDPKTVVAIGGRTKEFDSFFAKANKTLDRGGLKYQSPFDEIEDLVGFRVIVVARLHVDIVCQTLRDTFDIVSESNKSKELLEKGQLGYESHHLICRLGEKRCDLKEYDGLCDQKFEVQVRTALQHAWAENEHRIQYKQSKKDPELTKRFLRLAGIISAADEEFDRIYELNERLRTKVEGAVAGLDNPSDDGDDISEHDADLRKIALKFGVPASQLVRDGRYSEAIQVYDEFIRRQPGQLTHYAGRAKARALSGDIDGALNDLESASKIQASHPAVMNGLRLLTELMNGSD